MDGYVTIKTNLDNSDFDREISLLQDKLEGLEEEYNIISREKPFEGQNRSLKQLSAQIITTKKRMQQLRNEQEKINKLPLTNIQNSIDGIGKSLKRTVNTVVRWGLALIGVRGVMSLIRSSMATLTQYDSQLEANMNYMKFALATALKPVIEWIIQALYTILKLVGQIIYTFTGYNIFKNSGIGEYEKAMSNSEKTARKLQKTLAGFDEMNILNEEGGDTTGGGGGGTVLPNLGDLAKEVEMEPPKWMTWILKHKDEVIAGLMGIAGALGAIALGFEPLKALGIGLVFSGITLSYEGIRNFINGDYGWKTILETIFGPVAIGAGAYMITKDIKVALAVTAIATVVEAAVEIGKLHEVFEDVRKEANQTWGETWVEGAKVAVKSVIGFFTDLKNKITEKLDEIGVALFGNEENWDNWKKSLKNVWDFTTFNWKTLFNNLGNDIDKINEAIDDNGGHWESWKQGMGIIFSKVGEFFDNITGHFFTNLGRLNQEIKNNGGHWESWKQGMGIIFSKTGEFFNNLTGGFFTNLHTLNEEIKKNGGHWESWKQGMGVIINGVVNFFTNAFKNIKNAFKTILNFFIKGINFFVRALNKIHFDIPDWVPLIGGKSFGFHLKEIPLFQMELAKGGIINMPGRGVPVGGAIAGERGAEGVIPLTDSQQMSLLGEAIGRYITVNANITTTMNGRVISRELQKVQNDSDFAYNR